MSKRIEVVQFESPFGAESSDLIVRNVAYAMLGMRDSLYRGEAPLASHLLYTQMLDDTVETERNMGITAGLELGAHAVKTVVYEDLGISRGMQYGIDYADQAGRPVEYRRLYDESVDPTERDNDILSRLAVDREVIRAIYARGVN